MSATSIQTARSWEKCPIAPDFQAIPRNKTGARAAVILALYESDLTNRPANQCIEWIASSIGINSKLRKFAYALVQEADNRRSNLDQRLNLHSRHRTMHQTSPVVRNILRAAIVEMELFPATRPAIIVSEAVKLSQMFDTHDAGRFVNGVLGAVVRDSSST